MKLQAISYDAIFFSPQKLNISQYMALKKKAILQYTSQIQMVFPDGLVVKPYEIHYIKQKEEEGN